MLFPLFLIKSIFRGAQMSKTATAYNQGTLLRQHCDALVSQLTELQSLRLRVLRAEATTFRVGLIHRRRTIWRGRAARPKP